MRCSVARGPEWGATNLGLARVGALLACILLGWPHGAQAQASAEPAGYRRAIDEAVTEFGLAHFPESLALFERAHALYPNARTWRGIGMVEFELRHYVRSTAALDEALASKERPLDGALRSDTEELRSRAKNFVGELVLDVRPRTVMVRVDGISVSVASDNTLWLVAGDHVLDVQAVGYLSERRQLMVGGGTTQTVEIVLATAGQHALAATSEGMTKRSVAKNPWLWTAVGVVAAGVITGVAIASSDRGAAKPYAGSSGALVPGP